MTSDDAFCAVFTTLICCIPSCRLCGREISSAQEAILYNASCEKCASKSNICDKEDK